MLKVTNLTIEYRQLLFDQLSFTLSPGDKAGLIGLNGCGKSTLLKIIAGLEEPDKGTIEMPQEVLAYLPQEYTFPNIMVGEFLEELVDDPHNQMYRVNRILNQLKFTDIDYYQTINTLSYGQKMKLYLTKLLIDGPTLLLMDEPTNYLDLVGIEWVEEFIQNFPGICVIVSHDRTFLNNVTNKILEIDERKMNTFTGNYDDYLEQKATLLARREIAYEQQERLREKLEERIVLVKKFSSGKKQSKMLSNVRARLQREVIDKEIDSYKEQKISGLELRGHAHDTKLILEVKGLDFSYSPDKKVLSNFNFEMYGKEKVWLTGSNGAGKSTLVKLIIGQLQPDAGILKIGQGLKWDYFSQDQSHLDPEVTVEEFFLAHTKVSFASSFKVLEKFLFDKELRTVQIKKLSPGQRARLSFAIFAQQELDFLILDEPTNHLDIGSKEVIEQAFRDYKGAMLLISHDRYFVEKIGVGRKVAL